MNLIIAEDEGKRFEPLQGEHPSDFHGLHPDGIHAAMSTIPAGRERSGGIWELPSRRLVWAPAGCGLLSWDRTGTKLYSASGSMEGGGENALSLTAYSWPGRNVLEEVRFDFPGCGWDHLAASPAEDMIAVSWFDQCECGVELVREKTGLMALEGNGIWRFGSNLLTGPTFSPDGRLIAAAVGEGHWWEPRDAEDLSDEDEDEAPPLARGERFAGVLLLYDTKRARLFTHWFKVRPTAGWSPKVSESTFRSMITRPRFLSPSELEVGLPTDETRVVSLKASKLSERPGAQRRDFMSSIFWNGGDSGE